MTATTTIDPRRAGRQRAWRGWVREEGPLGHLVAELDRDGLRPLLAELGDARRAGVGPASFSDSHKVHLTLAHTRWAAAPDGSDVAATAAGARDRVTGRVDVVGASVLQTRNGRYAVVLDVADPWRADLDAVLAEACRRGEGTWHQGGRPHVTVARTRSAAGAAELARRCADAGRGLELVVTAVAVSVRANRSAGGVTIARAAQGPAVRCAELERHPGDRRLLRWRRTDGAPAGSETVGCEGGC